MANAHATELERFRIWIVEYTDWTPVSWRDTPPNGVVLEPASDGHLAAREAAEFVEGFNRAAMGRSAKRWAVARPVLIR